MPDRKIWKTYPSFSLPGFLAICCLMVAGSSPSPSEFEAKVKQGNALREHGEFHQAMAAFEEAFGLARMNDDRQAQLVCLIDLGTLNWDIGKIKDSDRLYRQALSLSQELGLKDREAQCSAYIKIHDAYVRGKEACASGLHQDSISQFSMAIGLARKIKSPEHELKCLRQMSLNYYQTKMYGEYLSLNNKALTIAKRIRHLREEARCLNNIGIFFYENNSYTKALTYYGQALSILGERIENDSDLSAILNNMGAIYRELGAYEKALTYIKRALDIDRTLNDYEGISVELGNLAATHRRKGIYLKDANDIYLSLRFNLESLEVARKIQNKTTEISAMNNIGLVYATNKNYAQALKYFRLAANEAHLVKNYSEACNVYANMGFVFIDMKDYEEAEECFRKGLELVIKVDRNDVLWEIYFGLGQCLEKKGGSDAALVCYEKAIDTIDYVRNRLTMDDYKVGFIRDKMKAYEALLNLLYDLKEKEQTARYDEEIFEVIEKAKARAFLEELGRSHQSVPGPGEQEYKNEEAALSRRISLTISELIRHDLGEGQRQKLLSRLDHEEDEYTSLLNRTNTEAAEHFGVASPQVISVDRIRKHHLNGRAAILEYYLGEERSLGILIARDKLVLNALPPRAQIEDALRAYLKMISTPPDGHFRGILAARRIYRDLVFPFQEALSQDVDHLILVPDGILHYLPFESLVRNDPITTTSRYLIELYDISYAPSATSFVYLKEKEEGIQYKKTLLAVGAPAYLSADNKLFKGREKHGDVLRDIYLNDGFELAALPHSKREVHRVARCFPRDEVELLSESQANEENFKGRPLSGYQFIHFACHAFLDEKTPTRSALVLTLDDDPNEDGFLQAREIAKLQLNADLVVLSACQTGKGRLENGEGVLGLPRSFFYAGARSTISSLWKINDRSTSEIMPEFYRCLAAGHNKARSLRLAKLKMLRSRFSHPFYWAAFILNGDYLSGYR